ncbi:hypothetical protein C922_04233 [Plasmodium inui San Antonio 1]|uniref:Uncharacterized protein n=1 Tax=Plasmodium inui San Antonio 1 TaxID=1237626 RepID=W7A0Y0_9APIC|nr:hypothetical protein C922_04233 [Plasmodium inui San Antonio 1]EUD65290.1 hypothetical protein C922_04233 [Plasmodium inui San Antonio 1]
MWNTSKQLTATEKILKNRPKQLYNKKEGSMDKITKPLPQTELSQMKELNNSRNYSSKVLKVA